MNKQQQLTFHKGITCSPSDAVCDDNELRSCENMVYDNGEYRPIQAPADFMQCSTHGTSHIESVLFVHKTSTQENYIVLLDQERELAWGKRTNEVYVGGGMLGVTVQSEDDLQIEAVGNILIVKNGMSITYHQWNGTGYRDGETKIPVPEVKFDIGTDDGCYSQVWINNIDMNVNFPNPEDNNPHGDLGFTINQDSVRNSVIGAYLEAKNNTKKSKGFVNPFAVRFALELYDGSIIYQSAPVLMFPSVRHNCHWWYEGGASWYGWMKYWFLKMKLEANYSEDWEELVQGIKVYVSREVEIYDWSNWTQTPTFRRAWNADHFPEGITPDYDYNNNFLRDDMAGLYHQALPQNNQHSLAHVLDWQRPFADIMRELTENGVFYELCTIRISDLTKTQDEEGNFLSYKDLRPYYDTFRLPNLEVQQTMANDEFYSLATTSSRFMSTYNQRLILGGLRRTSFTGFSQFSGHYRIWYKKISIVTYLKINGETKMVKREISSSYEIYGIWFYFPDPRASMMEVYEWRESEGADPEGWYLVETATLQQHPSLYGAYAFSSDIRVLNDTMRGEEAGWVKKYMSEGAMNAITTFTEDLPAEFAISEVNNPFVFLATGYAKIGSGEINGLSNYTTALSQGQFGQYPLIVFSTDGIWAVALNEEGTFATVDPMSRDVCNNPKSITQTDGAVFFSSEKGLMVAFENKVQCVSEQLNGKSDKPFAEFLKGALIAYDYRDSLLWIVRKDKDFAWIYNIKTSTFSTYNIDPGEEFVKNVINKYPDCLLQFTSADQQHNNVRTLLERPNINADENTTYAGLIETRPMKLENGLALKSIMRLRNICQMNSDASVVLHIEGSNDLSNWTELHTLRNAPWKYYRFRFVFSDMLATDRFAGTMLVTQERRTNKLR